MFREKPWISGSVYEYTKKSFSWNVIKSSVECKYNGILVSFEIKLWRNEEKIVNIKKKLGKTLGFGWALPNCFKIFIISFVIYL